MHRNMRASRAVGNQAAKVLNLTHSSARDPRVSSKYPMSGCVRYQHLQGAIRIIRYGPVNVGFGALLLLSLAARVNACDDSLSIDCAAVQAQSNVQTIGIAVGATLGSLIFISVLVGCIRNHRRAEAAMAKSKPRNVQHRMGSIQRTHTPPNPRYLLPLHLRQVSQDAPSETVRQISGGGGSGGGSQQQSQQSLTARTPAFSMPSPAAVPLRTPTPTFSMPSPAAVPIRTPTPTFSMPSPAVVPLRRTPFVQDPSVVSLAAAPPPMSPSMEQRTSNPVSGTLSPNRSLPSLPPTEAHLPLLPPSEAHLPYLSPSPGVHLLPSLPSSETHPPLLFPTEALLPAMTGSVADSDIINDPPPAYTLIQEQE